MISVCMATYNGVEYIKIQINSILEQLNDDDELVILDDNSNDSTIDVIKEFQDNRIKLYINDVNIGHVKAFEKAISLSIGDYIFLSDQDDFWLPGRIDICTNLLKNSNSLLLISNMIESSKQGYNCNTRKFVMPISSYFKNINNIFFSKSLYFGSLMCFKKELKNYILPFPKFVFAHDLYIALVSNSVSSIIHHNEVLLLRTNTGINLTYKKKNFLNKLYNKILLLIKIFYSFKFLKFE